MGNFYSADHIADHIQTDITYNTEEPQQKYKNIKKFCFFEAQINLLFLLMNVETQISLLFLLKNIKMPTIVGILIFISRKISYSAELSIFYFSITSWSDFYSAGRVQRFLILNLYKYLRPLV